MLVALFAAASAAPQVVGSHLLLTSLLLLAPMQSALYENIRHAEGVEMLQEANRMRWTTLLHKDSRASS